MLQLDATEDRLLDVGLFASFAFGWEALSARKTLHTAADSQLKLLDTLIKEERAIFLLNFP